MSEYLPCIELEPDTQADAAVIWLHGLGSNGHDFEAVVPHLQLPAAMAVRFILPSAGSLPITINNGHVMPAWFDILEIGAERSINTDQLLASAADIQKLIDREVERGIASERIILAGFSQGGAVNFEAGLSYPKPLAGILALSTFFPTAETVTLHAANHNLPIQVFHGTEDPVLNVKMAENTVEYLRNLGLHPEYKTYPIEHTVSQEEISDISTWFQKIL